MVSCNFDNLLHAKWSNLANTQHNPTKFSEMLGGDEKILLLKKFKQRQIKLKTGYSHDLVRQTVDDI